MIEVLLLSIQSSSIGPNNLELLKDPVQLTHPGQKVKLKPRTNILFDTGGTFSMMRETNGLHSHGSLHSPTTQALTTQLERPILTCLWDQTTNPYVPQTGTLSK